MRQLAQESDSYHLDVYIVSDFVSTNVTNLSSTTNLKLLNINASDCLHHGYQKTMYTTRNRYFLTAWDKALYYVNVVNQKHRFVWLIEDDVFIPSTRAFIVLHELYSKTNDLIVANNMKNRHGLTDKWWWFLADGYFPPPWFGSIANVVGLSRRFLIQIDEFVRWRGFVLFHEIFFTTYAFHLNYTVVNPFELRHLIFRPYFNYSMIKGLPNDLWHPIKDKVRQQQLRVKLDFQFLKSYFL